VFLSFLSGRRQRLAVRAPTTFRSLIFGDYRGMTGWQLWWRWTLANGIAPAIGLPIGLLLSYILVSGLSRSSISYRIITDVVAVLWIGFFVGGFVAVVQWWILRRYELSMWRWIFRLTLGFTMSALVTVVVIELLFGLNYTPLFYFLLLHISVLFYALLQWLILRRYVRNSDLMVLGNLIGAATGFVVDISLYKVFPLGFLADNYSPLILLGILGGLSYGAVTGLFLLPVLRRWRQPNG
jgi:hypothetical protein